MTGDIGFIIEKDTYHCADRSRQKFTLMDNDGKSVEDPDCRRVIQLTASGMPHIKDVYEDSLFSPEASDERVEEHLHNNYNSISKLDQEPSQFKNELSKIVPSRENESVKSHEPQKETIFEVMRRESAVLRAEQERDNKENQYNKEPGVDTHVEIVQPLQPKMIGITLGALDKFRQGYRTRRKIAEENGTSLEDVEIKYPVSLSSQFDTQPERKDQFLAFITS